MRATQTPRRLDARRLDLVRGHLGRADDVAARYARKFRDPGLDFREEARLALCLAAADYDGRDGVAFWTVAYPRVVGACRDLLRGLLPYGWRRPSRYRPGEEPPWTCSLQAREQGYARAAEAGGNLDVVGDYSLKFAEPESGDEPADAGAEWEDEVAAFCKGLSTVHREIVTLYYLHAGHTMKRVGEAVRLSEASVSVIHKDALRQIRARLGVA